MTKIFSVIPYFETSLGGFKQIGIHVFIEDFFQLRNYFHMN